MGEQKMNMLVLGGGGFIGSHLVGAVKSQYNVSVLERIPNVSKEQQNVTYIYGDFGHADIIKESLKGIDIVVHLISTTVPKTADADPVFDLNSNLINTIGLLKLLPETKVKKLVYFSSGGTVYGEPKTSAVKEDHPREPICSYGIVKGAIEDYVRFYASKNTYDYLIIRPSNPYGPGQISYGLQGVIPVLFDAIINNKEFQLWGGGDQIRDYIFIDDLTEAVLRLITSNSSGVYNVGSGQGHDVKQLVEAVENVMSKKMRTFEVNSNHNAVKRFVLSINKLTSDTGWQPQVALKEGLKKYYIWLNEQSGN
jgi:UDP-glucose 4-epimerase